MRFDQILVCVESSSVSALTRDSDRMVSDSAHFLIWWRDDEQRNHQSIAWLRGNAVSQKNLFLFNFLYTWVWTDFVWNGNQSRWERTHARTVARICSASRLVVCPFIATCLLLILLVGSQKSNTSATQSFNVCYTRAKACRSAPHAAANNIQIVRPLLPNILLNDDESDAFFLLRISYFISKKWTAYA